MRIAQVSPLFESVPPQFYGGTERVVSYLTEELVNLGHQVTLFASGDSTTQAHLVSPCESALRLGTKCRDKNAPHVLQTEQVFKRCKDFDIIHFHTEHFHFPLSRRMTHSQAVTTLHGRLDLPELVPLFKEYSDIPLISISNHQRKPLSFANWAGTAYHGLPLDLYPMHPFPEDYLAFIGRFSPEKGADIAIQIAKRCGIKIKVAAKFDEENEDYFQSQIEPLLKDPLVEYLGEISESEKPRFLGQAKALLFPISWPEPFGLVMIEAMACGTPVIAFRAGSVSEVVDEGVTGFIVENAEEAISRIKNIGSLDRTLCRKRFERRFSVTRMAKDHLEIYQSLIEQRMLKKFYSFSYWENSSLRS